MPSDDNKTSLKYWDKSPRTERPEERLKRLKTEAQAEIDAQLAELKLAVVPSPAHDSKNQLPQRSESIIRRPDVETPEQWRKRRRVEAETDGSRSGRDSEETRRKRQRGGDEEEESANNTC